MASRTDLVHVSIILVVSLGFVLPPVFFGALSGHDATVHLLWSNHFAAQMLSGDLYPRWLQEMNGGLGSPVFFYYSPFPYVVTTFFHLFTGASSDGWTELGLACAVALAASGIAAYAWLKPLAGNRSALIAALFYVLMPYHLAVDLFIRFAFGELWAFVWMPLLLLFARRLTLRLPWGLGGSALCTAMLVTSHLPTALIFFPIPLCHAIALAERVDRRRVAGKAVGAAALGLLLSAAYLLPALTTQGHVSMDVMWGELYDRNFLLATWGGMKPLLNSTALYTTAVVLGAFRLANDPKDRRERAFLLVTALGALFLMTPASALIWKAVPLLQKIQFPFRLLALLALAAAGLVGLARVGEFRLAPGTGWLDLGAALAVYTCAALMLVPDITLVKERSRGVRKSPRGNRDRPEYRPRWAHTFRESTATDPEGQKKARPLEAAGEVRVDSWKPRRITLVCNLPEEAWVEVRQFYFPGWTARVEGADRPLDVHPSTPEGLVTIRVPQGERRVLLRLEAQGEERLGWAVSILSILAVTTSGFVTRLRRKPQPGAGSSAPAGGST